MTFAGLALLILGVLIMAAGIVAEKRPGLSRAERIAEMLGDGLDAAFMIVIAALAGLTLGSVLFGCSWRIGRPKPAWDGVPAMAFPIIDAPPSRVYDAGGAP